MLIKTLLEDVLQLFYPHLCIACQKENVPTSELFCIQCEVELSPSDMYLHRENQCTDRLSGSVPFYSGASMFRFYPHGRIQKIIHSIKYEDRTDIAERLGLRFGRMLKNAPHYRDLHLIIPVPLHPRKQRKRGYNQSEHFALGLGESLRIPVNVKSLVRCKATSTQTKKSREERILNMENAFRIKRPLKNKNILIVDDVITTGSTIEACASTIRRAMPEAKISFATIALAQ